MVRIAILPLLSTPQRPPSGAALTRALRTWQQAYETLMGSAVLRYVPPGVPRAASVLRGVRCKWAVPSITQHQPTAVFECGDLDGIAIWCELWP